LADTPRPPYSAGLNSEAAPVALDDAGVEARDVDRVLLTGGSANIPAFRTNLAQTFGSERLEQRDAFTAVVHGLGVRAQQLWGRAQNLQGARRL
jgi:molecular chaperone DnaK (HSP70)